MYLSGSFYTHALPAKSGIPKRKLNGGSARHGTKSRVGPGIEGRRQDSVFYVLEINADTRHSIQFNRGVNGSYTKGEQGGA